MFVGHYAAALAAKPLAPRAPLWATVAGCQLVDIGWSVLIMAGVERASVDESLPGSPLVLEHMPWTHSLPMTFVWSIGAALLARFFLKLPVWACAVIGLSVASHWALDVLVHRPDLALWFGGPMVGLGLWNYPVPEQAVEIGLIAVAGVFWAAWRNEAGRAAWPAAAFIAFLVTLQIAAMLTPLSPNPVQMGASALVVYLLVTGAALLVERPGRAREVASS